jgi:multicomponent Na+:H+ antiporter subunit E
MLALGAGSVALCVWLAQRMGVFDEEVHPAHFQLLPLLRYWVWLLGQIVLSALDVARRVLDPSLPIDPVVVTLPVAQSTEMGRTTYANSITLTPGTVCLDVDEDTLRVHALTGEGASALREGEMNRRVAALEQGD